MVPSDTSPNEENTQAKVTAKMRLKHCDVMMTIICDDVPFQATQIWGHVVARSHSIRRDVDFHL